MLHDELYRELRRIIREETEKFADTVTDRCIELIEEYTNESPPDFLLEDDPPCTMPVLDSIDDILSAMSGNFEKARQEIENKNNNS